MKQKNSYGALYFDAPLQSWGYQSRYDERTSLSYPTRSGIAGLICAAMGIDREDTSELGRVNKGLISLDVAVFQPGKRLIDYHTVGAAYPKKTNRIPVKADGKEFNTVVTRREYLADAKFGLVIEGETSLLESIGEALRWPQWGIWFGRKSCVPAVPVWHGSYDDPEDAWSKLRSVYENRTGRDLKEVALRFIREVDDFEKGTDTISDVPENFSSTSRRFRPRRISISAREMT